jgi:hypothetical protein
MASKIDQTHFGRPMNPNIYNMSALLFGIFVNPNILAMALYTLRGEWMWQFDGKIHTDESCDDCGFETNRANRPTTLIWSLNKMN